MADPHQNTHYHQIKSNFGYCLQFSQATELVKRHEENTGTRYAIIRSDPNFGNATWNNEDCRINWEESDKVVGERLMFDGVPFFVLGTRFLGCQFGNENSGKMSIYVDWKKDADGNKCEAKKQSCPAIIILKEVIKFPDYKIDVNTNYERKKWSKIVRDDLCKGSARTERRIYVELPNSESHVHTIIWKQNEKDSSTQSHCLVCNAKLSSATRSTVSIFSDAARTSHRQLEVSSVLSEVVNQELSAPDLHSTIICSKCFNLLDDIDSLEEQLANKKQMMNDRYTRTMSEINGNQDSSDNAPVDFDDDDVLYGKRHSIRGRGRGKSPGRSRGRGPGRPRIRTKPSKLCDSPEKSIVKLEVDEEKMDSLTAVSYFTAMTSPPTLKTIKKEDIMCNKASPEDHPSSINEEDDESESIVAVIEPEEAMVDQVSVELQEDDLGVRAVLEKKRKKKKKQLKKIYSCSECDKRFYTRTGVRNHTKVHSRVDFYDCHECAKSFPTKSRLKEHLKTHDIRDRPYNCQVCNKSFYKKNHLNVHMKCHTGYRNFICDICGKALSTEKTLELHALTHSGEKPFQCEICGSTFRQRSNLHAHIKATHYQEKNHHCLICQKSFVRKRLLVYHMNSTHTGERPYKCEVCSATFVYPHHYKRHLRKHTGVKPHACHICAKQFTSRENRNAHLFIHSTKRPYECKICGAGFMRKNLCVSHLLVHAPVDNPESYIVFNSPSLMVNTTTEHTVKQETVMLPDEGETDHAVQAVSIVEGTVTREAIDDTMQIYAVHDNKLVKIMSRPVDIIESDDSTQYVIHTTE